MEIEEQDPEGCDGTPYRIISVSDTFIYPCCFSAALQYDDVLRYSLLTVPEAFVVGSKSLAERPSRGKSVLYLPSTSFPLWKG